MSLWFIVQYYIFCIIHAICFQFLKSSGLEHYNVAGKNFTLKDE